FQGLSKDVVRLGIPGRHGGGLARYSSMRENAAGCTAAGEENDSGFANMLVEQGASHGPHPIRRAPADAQSLGGLLMAQAGEITELYQLRCLGIVLLQRFDGLIQSQKLQRTFLARDRDLVESHARAIAAALDGALAACSFHEDAP